MKQAIHYFINKGESQYVAECAELAIVTQGNTLDELFANIKEATDLHLEVESPDNFGLVPSPLISVNYEFLKV